MAPFKTDRIQHTQHLCVFMYISSGKKKKKWVVVPCGCDSYPLNAVQSLSSPSLVLDLTFSIAKQKMPPTLIFLKNDQRSVFCSVATKGFLVTQPNNGVS